MNIDYSIGVCPMPSVTCGFLDMSMSNLNDCWGAQRLLHTNFWGGWSNCTCTL